MSTLNFAWGCEYSKVNLEYSQYSQALHTQLGEDITAKTKSYIRMQLASLRGLDSLECICTKCIPEEWAELIILL